jgi:hypothetical protein
MIFRQKILIDWVALKQVRQLQAVANNAKERKQEEAWTHLQSEQPDPYCKEAI